MRVNLWSRPKVVTLYSPLLVISALTSAQNLGHVYSLSGSSALSDCTCIFFLQAVWTLTEIPSYNVLGSNGAPDTALPVSFLYVLSNTAGPSGGGCLAFGQGGTDQFPSRQMFGSGDPALCGFADTTAARVNHQAVFKLQPVVSPAN